MGHTNPPLNQSGWAPILLQALDDLDIKGYGTLAARPLASAVQVGFYYFDTDRKRPTFSNGVSWRFPNGQLDPASLFTPSGLEVVTGVETASVASIGLTPSGVDARPAAAESGQITVLGGTHTYPTAGTWVTADASRNTNVGNTLGTLQTRTALGAPNSADGQWYERILFSGDNWVVTTQKFRFCTFQSQTASFSATPDGSNIISVRGPAQLEDCTVGVTGGVNVGGGGPANPGFDKVVQLLAFQGYTGGARLERCNIYGGCIPVYMETEQSHTVTQIIDCYLHDIYSSAGDHTDIVNGNAHASNVLVRGCLMDGVRTGSSFVTNGFGIYDDPSTSAGIWTNWTVDHCDVYNCATALLCSASTARATNPFVVTNNVWRGPFSLTPWDGRAPSVQSGNKKANGTAIADISNPPSYWP
jgi:hypothetical protein